MAHAFEEHTSEVRVRLSGADMGALLREAGEALAELLAEGPPGALQAPERVAVSAHDPEALLVKWINELIFLSETRKRVYPQLEIREASERAVEAEVRGWAASRVRTQVKAATFHKLAVVKGPDGYTAEVVLDV